MRKQGIFFNDIQYILELKFPIKIKTAKSLIKMRVRLWINYNNSFELRKDPNVFTTMIKSWSPPPLKVTSTDGRISKRSVWGSTDMYNKYEALRKQMNEKGKFDISNKKHHFNKINIK